MNEIEPRDRRGTTDAKDAVDIDFVARRGEGGFNNLKGLSHELGRHQTLVADKDVVQRKVGLDKRSRILIGKVQVKEVSDPETGELGDMGGLKPASLIDPGCDLFGFKSHGFHYALSCGPNPIEFRSQEPESRREGGFTI